MNSGELMQSTRVPLHSQFPPSNPHSADFPINWEDEHQVTRRTFVAFLLFLSATFLASTGSIGVVNWLRRRTSQLAPVRIAQLRELPIGGVKLFRYPTASDPCLLIRASAERFLAYSQKCTHLSCPVVYQAAEQQFYCPCHAGRFAVEDGRPLSGPPKRPLPRIEIQVTNDEIWAVGVQV
ncbi:MAG TPA: Rieske 2Fe-2S domain-containing protein [Methylomirabilota bacterium]|jgi:Rieske Fe-S protein|nr:Rieske 2Fe-2S domain-containing protein [Methylomirabilota bacterium]